MIVVNLYLTKILWQTYQIRVNFQKKTSIKAVRVTSFLQKNTTLKEGIVAKVAASIAPMDMIRKQTL